MTLNIRGCVSERDRVIILSKEDMHVTDLKKEDVKFIKAYIVYSVREHDGAVAYTKYEIKSRYLDCNNNLILICGEWNHVYK